MSEPSRTRDPNTERETGAVRPFVDARVLGLTVLYHPDLSRVGERALLTGVGPGQSALLSRTEPAFAAPGGSLRRPLEEARLSRSPIRLHGGVDGAVTLDCRDTRTSVVADGQPVAQELRLAHADLEHGVVLLLGGRVALLLSLVEPLAGARGQRFGLIGESPAMVRACREIEHVADLDIPVLIRGASGTGKELIARALHDAGPRREQPFVAVNLGAVPPALAASELFGATKGAFTGATHSRPGYFQRAQGGTLFLDEIGEAPPELQVMLLRALETREIQPVGAPSSLPVDVRVIAATDADLEREIGRERFRAPLLHRLSGYVIRVPPLAQRREDIGRLLAHFLARELAAVGRADALSPEHDPWLPARVATRLAQYAWPGNVRQLGNVVRQLVIGNRDLHPAARFDMLDELGLDHPAATRPESESAPAPSAPRPPAPAQPGPRKPADITEDELVAALRANRFRPVEAAAALGIPRSSIYPLMDRSPRVRKASELERAEILRARDQAHGSVQTMAELLEVSELALRRRMGELDLT